MQTINIKSYEIKLSKTELPIPVVNEVHLHSAYNPEKEAEAFIQKNLHLLEANRNLLILGLGFGYHVKIAAFEMNKIHGGDYCIYVLEPNKEVVHDYHANFRNQISEQVTIVNEDNLDAIYERIDVIEFLLTKPSILAHTASFNLYSAYFKSFLQYESNEQTHHICNLVHNKKLRESLLKVENMKIGEYLKGLTEQNEISEPDEFLLMAFNSISKKSGAGVTK